MKRHTFLFAAVVAASVWIPLAAADGELIAETASAVTFRAFVSDGSAYVLTSIGDLSAWPVTWLPGEKVVATAMDGTEYTLSNGSTGTTSAVLAEKGGAWTLLNSEQGNARVCVPWSVCQGYAVELDTGSSPETLVVDTVQDGPDRKSKKSEVPPVAYSGDDWAGDLSKAATLAFTPPEGGEPQTPTLDPAGTGVKSFTFDKPGNWTVTLTFADGTMKTATITIETAGLILIIR